MKKTVIAVLVVLALMLLVVPGAVGLLAENQFRALSSNLDSETPGVRLEIENYDRGWFSSRASYRLRPEYPDLEKHLHEDLEAFTGLPSLLIEAEIIHGPVPLAALGRDNLSYAPAIAQSFDRVSVAFDDRELISLPARVTTRLRFSGNHSNDIEVAPFVHEFEGPGTLTWDGMRLSTRFNSDLDRVTLDGHVGAVAVRSEGLRLNAGPVRLESAQRRSTFGLWFGDARLSWQGLEVEATDVLFSVGELALESHSDISGEMFNQAMTATLAEIGMAGWKGGPGKFSMSIEKLDARAMGQLTAVLGGMSFDDGEPGAADVMPLIVPELQALLAGGPHLALHEMSMVTPDGVVMLAADLAFPESAPEAAFGFILGLEGSARLRFPARLMDALLEMNPEEGARLKMLTEIGFLIRDDDSLALDAAVKGGLLTVNGQPIPLPLGF